ncbi:MAG: nickel/cobalt transporter, partial [Hyphomicrobiaceae bacterium]|nr:nickel/cobalt transporter [Hyphomicrobiaceae bacterium]
PTLADELYSLPPDVTKLPDDLAQAMRGVQGSIIIACPTTGKAPEPPTALEAVNLIGNAKPVPFNGPPPEPGLNLPRVGIIGWIYEVQKTFYAALSDALGRIHQDANAFWLLGGLSFIYGIFHAAGPGHGKVVISSYVLANEAQLRRGVLLSFLSAMVQSTVAVVFVMAAAAVLHLSSIAMSSAANWIGIGSYGLVALLGAYLIIRHLFFGHRHDHGHAHKHEADKRSLAHAHLYGDDDDHGRTHHGHTHDHDHDDHHHDHDEDEHDHVHVVTADQARGSWREQLAVVLGVGLRPCSGALVVLVFALSQAVVPAGIAAVYLMGLRTAITVAILATIASTAKGAALRFSGGGAVAATVVWWLELAGAVGVLAFGLLFVLASLSL